MAEVDEDDLGHLVEIDHHTPRFYTGPRPRREPIVFVKGTGIDGTIAPVPSSARRSVAESYRNLVLKQSPNVTAGSDTTAIPGTRADPDLEIERSASASLLTTRPLQGANIASQLNLQYVKPPSNLDRSRKGLRYLEAQGWDPDKRAGLGANEEGIAYPIKAIEKKDKAGVGVPHRTSSARNAEPAKVQKLNAKQARRFAQEEKRKHERLQRLFYQDDRIEKYLRPDAT